MSTSTQPLLPINGDNAVDKLFDQLKTLEPLLRDAFKDTVDYKGLWDGRFDRKRMRMIRHHNGGTYVYHQPLTVGSFTIYMTAPPRASLLALSFQYELPALSAYWQPLRKNCITRAFPWSDAMQKICKSEQAFAKTVSSRLKSLIKGVNEWFPTSGLNKASYPNTYRMNNPGNHYDGEFGYLIGAIGRVRLLSEIHDSRCAYVNLPNNGKKINELAHEMLRLVEQQTEFAVAFERNICEMHN